jgi:hypothetical protein
MQHPRDHGSGLAGTGYRPNPSMAALVRYHGVLFRRQSHGASSRYPSGC